MRPRCVLIGFLHNLILIQHAWSGNLSIDHFGPAHFEQLLHVCPLQNVCTQGSYVSVSAAAGGQHPCCASCSCDDECQVEGQCCWGNEAKYRFLERPMSQCITPITKQLRYAERSRYASYFMVDECPTKPVASENCGDIHVAIWGSLQPVYSPSQKRTYKNKHCAQCHGVNDTIPWGTEATCDVKDNKRMTVGEIFEFFIQNLVWPNNCYVFFFHPVKDGDLDSERCYLYLKSTCDSETNYSTNLISNITFEEVEAACSSGFLAPFRNGNYIYRNPFCAICTIPRKLHPKDFCKVIFGHDSRFETDHEITALLYQDSNQMDMRDNVKERTEACYNINGTLAIDTCRPLLCPLGQRLDPFGACKFVVAKSKWRGILIVNIKLSSQDLTWSNIPSIIKDNIRSRKLEMVHNIVLVPDLDKWKLVSVFLAHSNKTLDSMQYLLCSVAYVRKPSDPEEIVNDVHLLFDNTWTIRLSAAGRSISVTAEWQDFKFDHEISQNNSLGPMIYIYFNATFQRKIGVPMLTKIFLNEDSKEYASGARLNKLNICPQVQLFKHEVTQDGPLLYIKRERKYLLDDLYVISLSESENRTVRVCLGDTDMRVRKLQTSGTCCSLMYIHTWMYVIMVFMTLMLL